MLSRNMFDMSANSHLIDWFAERLEPAPVNYEIRTEELVRDYDIWAKRNNRPWYGYAPPAPEAPTTGAEWQLLALFSRHLRKLPRVDFARNKQMQSVVRGLRFVGGPLQQSGA